MSGIKWNDYVKLDQVYRAEKMLKVSDIARLELAKFMYRYHKFKEPNFLPSVNTTACRRSLLFRDTKLWNAILVDMKQNPYHQFVKYYKNYLIHKSQN